MHELALELMAVRQELRGFREWVTELRTQVADLRDQVERRHGELIEVRTQHRIVWAMAGVAGATGLSALVLAMGQMLRHAAPIFLVMGCALLASCAGTRLSPAQAQDAADGLAGIAAAQLQTDSVTDTILAGAAEHIEALAAGTALPPPVAAPATIRAEPERYHAAAQVAHHQADTTAATWAVPWWGWMAGAASAVLGVARMLPGPGGAVADLAWTLLAPEQHRQRDRRQQADADAYQQITDVLAALAPHQTVADVRNRLAVIKPTDVAGTSGALPVT